MLTLWGYDATACDSGAAALACARIRRPAAVLLDLAMPRMDGFEFARAFRALEGCETIPIIALSGYTSSGCSTRAREAGIGHDMLKPATPDRLKALLVAVTRPPVVALRHRNLRDPRRLGRRQPALACLVPTCPF
jgi:CheY-like chemotaxis protein